MFVELHILQNFAPSNLNRDDTGSPKDCEFGGYRRARISSQALKRAARDRFKHDLLVPEANLGSRSKRHHTKVVEHLVAMGHNQDDALKVTLAGFGAVNILFVLPQKEDDETKSQYLVYAGPAELSRFAKVCHDEWSPLHAAYEKTWATAKNHQPSKDSAAKAVAKAVKDKLSKALDAKDSADIALFGRMLADLPEKNIDAASQVAHALSTNKVSMEFDFYTAIDDWKPEDTSGADMMGTIEFNSACFYRYANLDMQQLLYNLGDDEDLARRTLDAFLRAAVTAIPTGKQNSMAAQNAPSLVFAVVRNAGLWSLANAFLKPVYPTNQQDLMEASIARLDDYWGKLAKMYGDGDISLRCASTLDGPESLTNLKETHADSMEDLFQRVQQAVAFHALS